jgi:nitroreductase
MAAAPLSLIDAFKWRHTVRVFVGGEFTPDLQEALNNALTKANSLPVPFSTAAQLRVVMPGTNISSSVKAETGWILLTIPRNTPKEMIERCKFDAGVRGQIAMMELSRHRIGTIWSGGYDKKSGDKLFDDVETVCGIAFGIGESTKWSVRGSLSAMICQPQKRQPFEALFWDVKNGKPFTEESAGQLQPLLQAVRSGPSAVNCEPWKFAVDGANIHLYRIPKQFASEIDMGIAIGNIMILALESNHQPGVSILSPAPPAYLGGTYVGSVSYKATE